MDLQKVEPADGGVGDGGVAADGGVPGLGAVDLSPERVQLMGMRTAAVVRRTLAPELRTVGSVVADERGLSHVHVRFSGWIDDLRVEQTGQKVKRDQLLGTIYSPDLVAAQQEYVSALAWQKEPAANPAMPGMIHTHDLTSGIATQARSRLAVLGMSPDDIRELERTGKPVRSIAVRAPAGGYVIEKTAVQGVYVQPGTVLFEIADLSKVWVIAEIYE